MATFRFPVESCESGHGLGDHLLEEEVCPPYSQEEEKDVHGHLLPFQSRELWR